MTLNPSHIPEPLKCLEQWLVWKLENSRKGKPTKVPYSAHGGMGKSNDPSTWAPFRLALGRYEMGGYDGLGFCLAEGDELVGIDLDKCMEDIGTFSNPQAFEICEKFSDCAYIEVSPSCKGLRLFVFGKAPRCGKGPKENKWIEVYDHTSPRYLTVTGNPLFGNPRPIGDGQAALDWLHETYMKKEEPPPAAPRESVPVDLDDREIIERIEASRSGADWRALYDRGDKSGHGDDHSSADLALCNMLAFWFGRDVHRMDRVFRSSGLMRDKWDRAAGHGKKYGEGTIDRAIRDCHEVYEPKKTSNGAGWQGGDIPPPEYTGETYEGGNGLACVSSSTTSAPVVLPVATRALNAPDQIPLTPHRPDAVAFPQTPLDHYIRALQDRTQAPYTLCAQSILAAATFSVQHLADIELPGIGGSSARRPISNFFITIAKSGERKSSADRIALEGMEARRRALESRFSDDMRAHKIALSQHQQKEAIAHERDYAENLDDPPLAPRNPVVLVKDPTQEGLFRSLKDGQLSQGLFNDEGGAFLGGHGMSKDNRMRTAATLNTLWDGAVLDRPRAKEHETLRGRRFSLHLMIQPQASEHLVGDAMLRDLGFTARCLAAEPESTIGARPFHEPAAASVEACDDFCRRLDRSLSRDGKEDEHGLNPRTLPLSAEARRYWIEWYNHVEHKLSTTYRSIQGFAGKTPEHALRLAAVLMLFQNDQAMEIDEGAMGTGIELMAFYLKEQLRLEVGRPTEGDERAELLLAWMRERGDLATSIPDICRSGPAVLRKKDAALDAVEACTEAGWLVEAGAGVVRGVKRRKTWATVQENSPEELSV